MHMAPTADPLSPLKCAHDRLRRTAATADACYDDLAVPRLGLLPQQPHPIPRPAGAADSGRRGGGPAHRAERWTIVAPSSEEPPGACEVAGSRRNRPRPVCRAPPS